MKKVLFIDRDGTIIAEPKPDCQVDSFEKLVFIPRALSNLRKIAEELDYELVMVTNQDGLGTASFPEETFWPVHRRMILTLAGENVHFAHVYIDRSFEHEDAPTRKPRTGLLTSYFNGAYDLANSLVIGDRLTDAQLAFNLGAKAILLTAENAVPSLPSPLTDTVSLVTDDWDEVYRFLRLPARRAQVHRLTNETQIHVQLNLDGTGQSDIGTGLGFFDHMLDQLAKHSGSDLTLSVRGDLHIDEHHTIEDTALALGEAYRKALGDKRGIGRYGFLLPMDDALAQAAIDFSGRNWLVWETEFKREKIGEMPTEMFYHFFKSFTDAAKCNLNVKAEGENEHHKIEAIFKAVAKSIRMAVARDTGHLRNLPTTKGIL